MKCEKCKIEITDIDNIMKVESGYQENGKWKPYENRSNTLGYLHWICYVKKD